MAKSEEFSFFEMDPNNLDVEWLRQPALYFRYASKVATLSEEVDQLKAAIGVVEAECASRIRENPHRYKVLKVTEKSVAERVRQMPEYQDAVLEHQQLKKALAIYKAAVAALGHRKAALENLVDLRLANYFAEPQSRISKPAAISDSDLKRQRARLAAPPVEPEELEE